MIDTPPALTEMNQAAVAITDVVVIPSRSSPHDLQAVGVIVAMADAAATPVWFVINRATPHTTIALEAVHTLAQHGKVAPVTMHQRIDFASSMVDGRPVGELNPGSHSAVEVTSLWQYALTHLRQDVKRT